MSVLCILIYNGKTRKGNEKGKLTKILKRKPRITMVNLLSALKISKISETVLNFRFCEK